MAVLTRELAIELVREQGSNIVIPNIYTSIADGAFESQIIISQGVRTKFPNLTSVIIPNSITSIGAEAFARNSLTSVVIPDSVTKFSGPNQFKGNKLTSIILSKNLTEISGGAFLGNQLRSINIPDGVILINDSAFADNQLESIEIPNSVKLITNAAFLNNQLTVVNIPDSVNLIGNIAFEGNNLNTVEIPEGTLLLGGSQFDQNVQITFRERIQIVENNAPTDIGITATSFDENIEAGSVVASFNTIDPDEDIIFSYSFADGTGATDNALFTIDGNQLKINDSPDFESKQTYNIRIQTTDAGLLSTQKEFTLGVNDIEKEPNTFAEYNQISINQDWQTINLNQTYTNAVIIASDPTLNDADPVTVRIRNVGTNSFQVRLQEPNYKDGRHINETISYLVAEVGDWELSDGTRISVGTQTSTKLSSAGFETINLESGFTDSATVLTQTQTYNGADWVTTRTKNIGTGSFQVTMQEEEQLNGGAHAQETIGWIAVDSGDSNDGDTQLASGLTADIFTQATQTHTFTSYFDSAPTLITKLSTFDGADTATSRIQSVSSTGFSALVQEEQSRDIEIAHTTESLAFLALDGSSGTLEGTAYQPTQTIGEYGQISVNDQWKSIDLTNTYTSPIVITSDPTIKGGDPTVVRLRNIDSNSFDLRLQEPNYKDGSHTNEVISYVVIEEGTWDLTDSTQIAAGSKITNKLSTQGREKVSFDNSFTGGPVVLTQTQTFNGTDWVTTRTDTITGNSFDVMLQEEEQLNNGGHVSEKIGWLAIDQGVATDGDTLIEGGMTPNIFTNQTKTYTFDSVFDTAPTLLTKLSTFDGADTANSRIQSVSSTGFSALVQEEQSKDIEIAHTTESLSFLAFNGTSGIIEAMI